MFVVVCDDVFHLPRDYDESKETTAHDEKGMDMTRMPAVRPDGDDRHGDR